MSIQIEQRHGPAAFVQTRQFLEERNCDEGMLPYPGELELLCSDHESISGGLGVLCFLREGRPVAYVPYGDSRRNVDIRIGEKSVLEPGYPALQIFRPNSAQFGDDPDVPRYLLDHVLQQYSGHAIFIPEIFVDTDFWKAFSALSAKHFLLWNASPVDHFFHECLASFEDFQATLSRNSRKLVRKAANRLTSRAGDEVELREYSTAESVSEFVASAHVISAKTYQARLFGELIEDTADTRKRFLQHAERGYFRSFILWAQGVPISFQLGFQTPDGRYHCAKTGYDPQWRAHSPGFNCMLMLLRRLYAERRPESVDFGSGAGEQKEMLSTTRRKTVSPILFPRSLRGTLLYGSLRATNGANAWVVQQLDRLGLKSTVKKLLRR